MWALVAAVFVASVLGSLHCAGMCGAFLAIAVGVPGVGVSRWKMQLAYHGGRLVSYSALGAAAGALGAAANVAGALAGLKPVAAILAGAVMIAFGIVSLLHLSGVGLPRIRPPAWLQRVSTALHRRALDTPPFTRALTIGLLTTLLPCGWLWAFVITAAGTGAAWSGALAMAVFWVGTLPVLVTLGAGMQGALGVLGRKLPVLTCLLLVGVGVWTLVGRSSLDPLAIANASSQNNPTTLPSADDVPACCR